MKDDREFHPLFMLHVDYYMIFCLSFKLKLMGPLININMQSGFTDKIKQLLFGPQDSTGKSVVFGEEA